MIAKAIEQADQLEDEWKKEKVIRDHQGSIWALAGVVFLALIILGLGLLFMWKQRLLINTAVSGFGRLGLMAGRHDPNDMENRLAPMDRVGGGNMIDPNQTAGAA